jgi:hypothetical protein
MRRRRRRRRPRRRRDGKSYVDARCSRRTAAATEFAGRTVRLTLNAGGRVSDCPMGFNGRRRWSADGNDRMPLQRRVVGGVRRPSAE